MKRYEYRNQMYTVRELAEMSGIQPHTIRDRLRRGYSVEQSIQQIATHDSIVEFVAASDYHDWIGIGISKLHEIYWKWSVEHGYKPMTQINGFSRQLMLMNPQLKTVPTKQRNGKCIRIIRLR